MPLTPTDVANKQFALKMRGYAVDEVDAFLEEVETELARLLRDNNDLRTRTAEAPASPEAAAAPAPAAPGLEQQEAALRTLLLAQRTADEAVAEARAEAAQLVQQAQAEAEQTLTAARTEAEQTLTAARTEAEQTLTAARTEAEQTLTAARTEAEQTLTAARTEAEQLRGSSRAEAETAVARARADAERTVAGARDQARQLEQQATARVQAVTGDLEERRRSLESRIQELHAFEREYRTRLRAYLESQLRELLSRTGPDDDGGAGVPAPARTAAVGAPAGSAQARPDGSQDAGAQRVGPFTAEPPAGEGRRDR